MPLHSFQRNEKGNTRVNIASTDYDDDYRQMLHRFMSILPSTLNWTEVTALYFKDHIWHQVSHRHVTSCKEFEPLLIWTEIQSFIKGSEIALQNGKPLSLEEYQELGNHMAPAYASHRNIVYNIFLEYQCYLYRKRPEVYLYDKCDRILHNRMKNVQDVLWSIHSLYGPWKIERVLRVIKVVFLYV